MKKYNKYTEEDYKNRCSELGMEFIGTYKEKKKGTMINFICPIHKDKGIQSCDWSHFRVLSKGCPYCVGRYKTTEEIQNEVYNSSVLIISEYLGNEKPITCKCKDCGNVWTTLPKVLITNKAGCPKCGRIKANKGELKSQTQFEKDLCKANPTLTIKGTYVGCHIKTMFTCNICNKDFESYPSNVLNGSAGCPRCNLSNSERLMLNTLDDLHIEYKTQYTIKDCRRKNVLRFDAFDVKNNIAFEYQGEQHYRPIDFAGKGKDWAKQALEITKERDLLKNNIAKIIIYT